MKAKIIKIGNSRGIRLPKKVLNLYGLKEGSAMEIEQNRNGLFLRPIRQEYTLSWEAAYQQMAAEREDSMEWEAWQATDEDGIDD
ncbi:MAG TPA: AbrB/MazE/SpoVT family DNA-binding domain-containing protein [Clostridia bacterium]|nr:AbrB/MazE/SpoVT family DNA-binding domain-containing protein [Clostridia bacterium]